ncbi:MAG: hypothetical protein IID44_19615 [Planctomycetes bacterium]|nr:hypothetical protein [Planctomycetota bacterium]
MSKTEIKKSPTIPSSADPSSAETTGPTTDTRIDPAHAINHSPQAVGASSEPRADSDRNEVLLEQVHLQASQLSDGLSQRQQDLDRRESQVHARMAELESQSRRARLWFERRQEDLEDQRRQLDEQREAMESQDSQSAEKTAQPTSIKTTKASLKHRERELRAREKELNAIEKHLLGCEQQAEKTRFELEHREQQLDIRSVEMSDGEVRLAASQLAVDGAQMQAKAELAQEKKKYAAQLEQLCRREQHASEQLADEQSNLTRQLGDEKSKMEQQLADEREKLAEERETLREQMAEGSEKLDEAQQQLLKDQEEAAGVLAERRTLFEAAARLDMRQQQLEEAESLLEKAQDSLVNRRGELAHLRDDVDVQARAGQEQIAQRRAELEAQWEEKRDGLDRRAEALQAREKALDRLRHEITDTHRDTLEMRVAIEEIWSQLSATMKPAALTQSLAGARSRLSDYYRLANNEMAERKEQLQQISHDLAQQHKQLAAGKIEMQQWVARRQEEIEVQAARLVGREQELDRQESDCEQLRRTWQQERLVLQHQLRARLAELRRAEPAVA